MHSMYVFYLAALAAMSTVGGQSPSSVYCFQNNIGKCILNNLDPSDENLEDIQCRLMEETIACRTKVAADCHIENNKRLIQSDKEWRELCRDGSELNKMFARFSDCLAVAMGTGECRMKILTNLQHLQDTLQDGPEKMFQMRLTICKLMPERIKCEKEKVLEACGPEAVVAYDRIHNSAVASMDEMVCDAIHEDMSNPDHLHEEL